jgi:hypothetical protein
MPTLPTLDVTQPQADRIIAAFGATQAEAVANYRVWLKASVIDEVLSRERQALLISQRQAVVDADAAGKLALGDDRVSVDP